MTPAIYQEWKQHQSLFAKKWLRCMIAKKKMITGINLTDSEIKQLRENIEEFDTSSNKVKAMLKDVHLLEAALATDCVVISSDETVRHLFSDLSQQLVSVKGIAWVNPTKVLESTIDWLENGANVESLRQLGHVENDDRSK
jgi:precorrin-6B methylase 2